MTTAVNAMGIGPDDEVQVLCHTYMATTIAVVCAGAIPVTVDIDETITIDPQAVDDARITLWKGGSRKGLGAHF